MISLYQKPLNHKIWVVEGMEEGSIRHKKLPPSVSILKKILSKKTPY